MKFWWKFERNLRKNPLVVTVTADGVTSTDDLVTNVTTTVKQHVGADGQIVTERTPMFTSPQNLDKGLLSYSFIFDNSKNPTESHKARYGLIMCRVTSDCFIRIWWQ